MRAFHDVPVGSRVLDVGATESTLSLSLATLGYRVTALDARPYPLSHPNLDVVIALAEEWHTDDRYDVAISLSALEHFGIGHYGEHITGEDADLAAMEQIRDVTRPGGLLILTAPFGEARVDDLERTYDEARLSLLLDGWEVQDRSVIEQVDDLTWRDREELGDSADRTGGEESRPMVVMLTARRCE
jgi:SAM-dependent methyltransferase